MSVEIGDGVAPDVEMVQQLLAIIPEGMRNDAVLATLGAAIGTVLLKMTHYQRGPAVLGGVMVSTYVARMIEMNTISDEEKERAN